MELRAALGSSPDGQMLPGGVVPSAPAASSSSSGMFETQWPLAKAAPPLHGAMTPTEMRNLATAQVTGQSPKQVRDVRRSAEVRNEAFDLLSSRLGSPTSAAPQSQQTGY